MPFEQVGEREVASEVVPHPAAASQTAKKESAAFDVLMLSLKALSQKTVVALSTCFTGMALLSAWLLWYEILPNPAPTQLIGVAGYAVFILLLEWIRRRR
jgi:hypothetical protein